MPLERLERRRPDVTSRPHPVRPQIERAEEPESSQPVLCRETSIPPAVATADTVQLHPQVRGTPVDVMPVEGKAKVEPELSTRDKTVDVHTSVDEDYQQTRDEVLMTSDNDRPEPTGSVRPANQYVRLTEPLIQPAESDKSDKEVGSTESEDVNPSPASDEGNIAQESTSGGRVERGIWYVDGESSEEDSETEDSDDDEDSTERYIGLKGSDGDEESSESEDDTEGPNDQEGSPERYINTDTNGPDGDEESSESENDTEGSVDEDEYLENGDENDSETASDASSPAPQRSQYFQSTPRRASARLRELAKKSPKEPNKATTSKRKTAPSQLTSDKGMKQRKRVKRVMEESDDCYEEEDKEDGKGEAANRRVPHKANRGAKILSSLQGRPPLSRNKFPWTEEEEETLFNLREEGKTWKHIGEGVLGRTHRSVRGRWQELRRVALKPIEARTTRDRQTHNSSVISMMARGQPPLPRKLHGDTWTKEEEETLFRLRKQGKTWEYVCKSLPRRTMEAIKNRWYRLKKMALKPIEARTTRRRLHHYPSVISPMVETLKIDYRSTWSKEQDDMLVSLRPQGLPINYISRRIPGKSDRAVWKRWQRIKDRYPQVTPNCGESRTGKKGIPSIRQNKSHSSLSTEYDGEENEAEWNVEPDSDSTITERESSSVHTE